MPLTKRSGCPGGHNALTAHPARTRAIAMRAERGHHTVAATTTTGSRFLFKGPISTQTPRI